MTCEATMELSVMLDYQQKEVVVHLVRFDNAFPEECDQTLVGGCK